ncbi:M61 family metallopeptidase [Sediminicola sp. 1XM1-17]|uniref:M61 family metallopeptidase n=1 Tax=Sediminicola sp. 1XM1-17 TaxID=3127702 RepID=UPI0030777ED9
MKKIILVLLTGLSLVSCGATKNLVPASNVPIATAIDLVNVDNDRVKVSVDPGAFTTEEVSFFIPKTVPGTYSEDNYGKYIENFKAFDYKGKEMNFSKDDDNTWRIAGAKNLDRVTYEVNDTYDTEGEVADAVFSPAGTNILKGENFMLNLHGFVGYFNDLQEVPYELAINAPKDLLPTTSLNKKSSADGVDVFVANRYFEVIDNPILYAKATAESFEISGITVNLVVYSPNEVYRAADLKERMQKMMGAQKSFLGEINSTEQYNILLYLSTLAEDDASGFGALEHHTSTVVVLPEQMPLDRLEQAMVDVVSHEFFHIVTPLSVHSKEIQFFDFNDPKMSEHLWMYEGTTEYFANLFQIQQGLIDDADFYKRIMDKINNSKRYDDDMSFTVMSKNILEDPYKDNYANVYEKGTLINLALDISLRDLSNGEQGVLWLLKELSKKYGDQVPFEDAELIGEITAMTYPEIGDFFRTHVIGDTPIDYSAYLSKVGLTTTEIEQESGYFLNGDIPYIDVDQNNGDAIFIREGIVLNSFFNDLGAKGGDVIKSIDGAEISLETIRPIIGASFGWSADKEIEMVVVRNGQELKLSGKVGVPKVKLMTIVPMEDATPEQVKLRNIWMKG